MLKGYTALEAVALEEPIKKWHVYNFSWFCQQSETDRFEEISIGAYKSLLIVFRKSALFSSWLPLFLFSSVNCFGQMVQTIIPMVSNLTSFKSINKCLYVFTKLDIIFDFLDNAKKLKEDLNLKALNQLLRPFSTTSSFIKRLVKRIGQLKDSTI